MSSLVFALVDPCPAPPRTSSFQSASGFQPIVEAPPDCALGKLPMHTCLGDGGGEPSAGFEDAAMVRRRGAPAARPRDIDEAAA